MATALRSTAGSARAVAVRSALQRELNDRRDRDRVFAPLAPLAAPSAQGPASIPPRLYAGFWRRLARQAPDAVGATRLALGDTLDPQRGRDAADALTALALEIARSAEPGDDAVLPPRLLAICPLARRTLPRLVSFLRTASPEDASALRLAYRDAGAVHDDAPPLLLDILAAHLDQPWQVLRLVSAVMDRPSDTFLAASELGRFGESLLDEIDARTQQARSFDPDGGAAAGEAVGEAVCGAVLVLAEFDRCVRLSPGGVWSKRISAQRRTLSRAVEMRLRQADPALARALPAPPRIGRKEPAGEAALDAQAARKARALLGFAASVRNGADGGGFAVARAKAAEAMDLRLSTAADDLVRRLHEAADARAVDALREALAFVAEALGALRDTRAAEVVRRRAAAA